MAFAKTNKLPGPMAPGASFVRRVWRGWYQTMSTLLAFHGSGWHEIGARHMPVLRATGGGWLNDFISLGNSHDEFIQRWEHEIAHLVEDGQHRGLTVGPRSYFFDVNGERRFSIWCSRIAGLAYATRGSNRQTGENWPEAWYMRSERSESEERAVAVPLRDFVPQRARSGRQRPDDLLAMLLAFAATRHLSEITDRDRRIARISACSALTLEQVVAIPTFEDSWGRVRAQLVSRGLRRDGPSIGGPPGLPGTRFAPPTAEIATEQALPLELSDELIGASDGLLEIDVDLGEFRAWGGGAAARQWFEGKCCWPVFIEVSAPEGRSSEVWLGTANDAEDLPDGRHRILVEWGGGAGSSTVEQLATGGIAPADVKAKAWLINLAAAGEPTEPTIYVQMKLPG